MATDTWIWYTTIIEGLHCYPEEQHENYLWSIHRHLFHIKVSIQVFGADREIEFIRSKRQFTQLVFDEFGNPAAFNRMSCEDIGQWVLEQNMIKYGNHRKYYIEVSEDGENGAVVRYSPDE